MGHFVAFPRGAWQSSGRDSLGGAEDRLVEEFLACVSLLEQAGGAAAAIRRRLAAASWIYRFALGLGLLVRSPLSWVRRPSGWAAPRLGLDPASLGRLWEAVRPLG